MVAYPKGGFTGNIIPKFGATVTIPDPFLKSSRYARIHKRISRKAGDHVMKHHHKKVTKEHFKQTNRSKYDHFPRTAKYLKEKRKRYGSITDLVATGKSKRAILSMTPKVTFKGSPMNVLQIHMTYRWPFDAGAGEAKASFRPHRVSIAQMSRELTSWTDQEMIRAVEMYRDKWIELWEEEMAKAHKMKRMIGYNPIGRI